MRTYCMCVVAYERGVQETVPADKKIGRGQGGWVKLWWKKHHFITSLWEL